MKKVFFCFILFLLVFNVKADVYKYRDENGKVYFVDSVYQIPREYLPTAEILPSGKEVNKVEKRVLTKLNSGIAKAGDMLISDLKERLKIWLGGYFLLFVIFLIYFAFKRDYLSLVALFLLFFLVWQGIYIFKIYPETRKAVFVYSYITDKFYKDRLSVVGRVKKVSLENRVLNKPLPLNPYRFYKNVKKIRDFYNSLSLGESLE